jgi:hypothetical protein
MVRAMSKLYAGLLVIASMLALSGLGMLGLVLITHLIVLGANMTATSLIALAVFLVALFSLSISVVLVSIRQTISRESFHGLQIAAACIAAIYAIWCAGRLMYVGGPVNADPSFRLEVTLYTIQSSGF